MSGTRSQITIQGENLNRQLLRHNVRSVRIRCIRRTLTHRLPARAIPGLITTVSHNGFPAVEHLRTCTLAPKKRYQPIEPTEL